jgi:hypothetical protein
MFKWPPAACHVVCPKLGVGSQVVVPCEALDTFGHTSLIHHCEGGGEVITACFDKANAAHKAREQQANGAFHDGGNALKVRCLADVISKLKDGRIKR